MSWLIPLVIPWGMFGIIGFKKHMRETWGEHWGDQFRSDLSWYVPGALLFVLMGPITFVI